ncbi:ADP compounds hydrolase NudE [Marinospirillum insulare]|uniref:ADP compounds hydrolase NudE n=1 Tax=Marinospirillum insulare TaxID=217169 RepID=A0ABQ5ZWU2_9GAMM|nr:ADP compounds hydrolase NudE [Marinospirillum insulare]GLR64641.1 ADP compounds hydrolase NudE [Marinospirillum insulare]
MPKRPTILHSKIVAKSRLFKVEELQLKFTNGVERTYERLVSQGQGAVMIVALNAQEELVLIREYAGGFHDYVLTLPKGLIDPGEDALAAANRELMEETGFGAHRLELLTRLSLAPNYMGHKMDVVLARDLYPCKLEGDEPEPLEVVLHPLQDLPRLMASDDFHEARSIAALFLTREKLEYEKQQQEYNGD